ncbi:MAG TPA: type II toxin-antitoxin system HicB family antitoxin [Azospirillum sp.]
MMEYKGYKAQIDFDDDAGIFVGEVINTRDGITFRGRSVDELRAAFHGAVNEYLALASDMAANTDRPASGQISIRVNPTLHRAIASCAQRDGKSVSAWIADRLGEAVGMVPCVRTNCKRAG